MQDTVYQLEDLGGQGLQAGPGLQQPAPKRKGRIPSPKEQLPPVLALALDWAAWAAGAIFLLCLAYFAVAIFAGVQYGVAWFGWAQLQGESFHPVRAHMLGNLQTAGALMATAAVYLSLYTLVSAYDLQDRFVALAVVFLLLHFGTVFLFTTVMAKDLNFYPGNGETNQAAAVILSFLTRSGDACLGVVGLRLVFAMVSLMRHGAKKLKVVSVQKAKEGPATGKAARQRPAYRPMSRCWETSYCQDYLLEVCQAWQAKKSCWKYGSGCMCDNTMLDRLIRIEMGDTSASTRTAARAPRSRYYAGPNKCHNCPIYLTHEEEKYRVLNPLVMVTVLALLVVYWSQLGALYQFFAGWIGKAIAAVAFGPTGVLAREWTENFMDPFVQSCLIVCAAIAIISYALKFVEWMILEKKL